MAQIASFKLMPRDLLEDLRGRMESETSKVVEELEEIERDGVGRELPAEGCPDEVYAALFEYIQMELGIDLEEAGEYTDLMTFWLESTVPMDVRLLTHDLAEEILAGFPGNGFDEESLVSFLADNWDLEKEHVEQGLQVLQDNLRQVTKSHCLVFLIF